MEKIRIGEICSLIAFGAFLCFLPSLGLSQPCTATVAGGSSYPSINAAVSAAVFGDTINVSGTCTETVYILANKSNITLNGGGTATIKCQSPPFPPNLCAAAPNMVITGTHIFVNGFNITGGVAGIQIAQGAIATINGNNIYGTQRNGMVVVMNSFATIVNNTIHDTGLTPTTLIPPGSKSVITLPLE